MDVPMLKQPLHFMKDQSSAPKWMTDTNEAIKNADAILVISSEYNCSIPPALTNVMDYFPPASYRHKPAGIICYSMGAFTPFDYGREDGRFIRSPIQWQFLIID
jgi:NAD(P)H-dependent FMN reductase